MSVHAATGVEYGVQQIRIKMNEDFKNKKPPLKGVTMLAEWPSASRYAGFMFVTAFNSFASFELFH